MPPKSRPQGYDVVPTAAVVGGDVGAHLRDLQARSVRTFTADSTLVTFRVRVRTTDAATGATHLGWRTLRAVLELRPGYEFSRGYLEPILQRIVAEDFAAFNPEYDRDTGSVDLYTDPAHGNDPVVEWVGSQRILDHNDLFRLAATATASGASSSTTVRLYGNLDGQHSFRYHIRGADVPTLQELLSSDAIHPDCQRTCVYDMLRSRNQPRDRNPITTFEPIVVNRWLNDHGHNVGGLTDGVSAEDIQAHAQAHQYSHAALDLTRSILLFHLPEKPRKDYKTIAYTVVGQHAVPFTDPDVIKSIMKSAVGMRRQRICNYGDQTALAPTAPNDTHHQQNRRKRSRSVDAVFQADEGGPRDTLRTTLPVDFETEDREEEIEGTGDTCSQASNGALIRRRRPRVFPLVTQTERFHRFTLAEDRALVRQKLHPNHVEPGPPEHIHYYVCTDQPDAECLYEYCLRVLQWDPTTCARSYNGRCGSITINNVVWTASPDLDDCLFVHRTLCPQEPFRMRGLPSYAMHWLIRETERLPGSGHLWHCLSQYPPNLQRIADTTHPFRKPIINQRTFHPPYGVPERPTDEASPVPVLIPDDQRHRLDLVRSYASCLLDFQTDGDQIPVHSVLDRIVPYDAALHGHLPVGHYLVVCPDAPTLRTRGTYEAWLRFPSFYGEDPNQPAHRRLLSHRMVRALCQRELLCRDTDIQYVCLPDEFVQKRGGALLVDALAAFVRTVYHHPEFQGPEGRRITKRLVNYLVGLCNGTTLPHSGTRLSFRNLGELLQIMVNVYTGDRAQNTRVSRHVGRDPFWQRDYDHYELTTSGITHRHLHLQPVYYMVLESQAIRLFDVTRPIPLANLIQINVDACEYRVRPTERLCTWVRDLQAAYDHTYDTLPPQDMPTQAFGHYKREDPKPPKKWRTYHYQFDKGRPEINVRYFVQEPSPWSTCMPELVDTEHVDLVPDWHAALRRIEPGLEYANPDTVDKLCLDWLQTQDYTGILLTGPAGSGKTHLLRRLYDCSVNVGRFVQRSAFTHAACIQMGADAVTLSSLFGLDVGSVDTRCLAAYSHRFLAQLRNLRLDVLIVDEISMIPLAVLEVLYLFKRLSPQTRFVLSGDFNQLPPVEPGLERSDGHFYLSHTDIFPYLLYDRLHNIPGLHIHLTECMRSDDPLLQHICRNPLYAATDLNPQDYSIPPGIAVWRFLCATNRTRRATNWYCLQRWMTAYPDRVCHPFNLRDIYASTKATASQRYDADHFRQEFDSMTLGRLRDADVQPTKYVPRHWDYLQNFAYSVHMEVVCRNNVQDRRTPDNDKPQSLQNNRRARILAIDPDKQRVTLQWLDILWRSEAEQDEPLLLTYFDFAFNFVPGFCVTVHLAQGETIREHYAVLEWQDIVAKPAMAYVAVTRASHPKHLHIIHYRTADPWDTASNHDVRINAVKKLFQFLRHDYKDLYPWLVVPTQHLQRIVDTLANPMASTCFCEWCKCPLLLRGYVEKDPNHFRFSVASRYRYDTPDLLPSLLCAKCYSSTYKQPPLVAPSH